MENSVGIKYLFAQRNFDSRKVNSYNEILLDAEFTDVTLATNDDKQVDAHRIILSSESLFFKRILKMNARRDILIYLPNINHEELQILLEYIYLGQTEIGEGNLIKFLSIGKDFELRGFDDENIGSGVHDESFLSKITDQGYKGDSLTINKQRLERLANGKFACDHCDYQSVTRRNIKRHMESVHYGIKYQCDECPREYSSTTELKRHVESVHKGEVYQCDQCNKTFGHPKSLRFHTREYHEGLETTCNECNKDFSSYSALGYHTRKEHKGYRYSCNQCDHQAVTPGNLKIHQKAKHGEVSSSCDQCDFQSKWPTHLRTHKKRKHCNVKTEN